MKFILPAVFLGLLLVATSVSGFRVSSEVGDTVDIKMIVGGKEYSQGALAVKMPEGDSIEVSAEFVVLSSNGFEAKLLESNSGSVNVTEGKAIGSLVSFGGLTSVDKKQVKWVFKPTGSAASTAIDLYYKYLGEGRVPVTVNLANITITQLRPEKITSISQTRLPKGFTGNITIKGEYFPKDIKLEFLNGSSVDTGITAALSNYLSKAEVVFLVNVSKDAEPGSRGIRLGKGSGTAFDFANAVEIVAEGGDYAGELKIDETFIPEKNLVYFFAYVPGFKGNPVLAVSNDQTKTKYLMEPEQNKSGLFVYNLSLNNIGLKVGDLLVYTVAAGSKVEAKSALLGTAAKGAAPAGLKSSVKAYNSEGVLDSLKIGSDSKLVFLALFAGLADIGGKIKVEGGANIEVTLSDLPEYQNSVNDFHIIFGGEITNCKALLPEWVCKILDGGNSIDLKGPAGKPLVSGKPFNITEVYGQNITIKDFWATINGSRVPEGDGKYQPEFDDCTDFYCPGETAEQLKDRLNGFVQSACERLKNILDCLKSGKINSVMDKISRTYQPALKDPAKVQRIIKILEEAVKKCAGLTIECDSKWNYGCWNDDVNAYVLVHHSIGDHLHLCPGFCTEKDPEGTIFHELTHFGDSTDDPNDDTSAHNLALNSHSIAKACSG